MVIEAGKRKNQEPEITETAEVISQIPDIATANAVVGRTEERQGRLAIPLASVSAAYGIGFGLKPNSHNKEGSNQSGGAGRGSARPVAVVELTNSDLKVHQVVDSTRITITSLALAAWCVFWITKTIRAFKRN